MNYCLFMGLGKKCFPCLSLSLLRFIHSRLDGIALCAQTGRQSLPVFPMQKKRTNIKVRGVVGGGRRLTLYQVHFSTTVALLRFVLWGATFFCVLLT